MTAGDILHVPDALVQTTKDLVGATEDLVGATEDLVVATEDRVAATEGSLGEEFSGGSRGGGGFPGCLDPPPSNLNMIIISI